METEDLKHDIKELNIKKQSIERLSDNLCYDDRMYMLKILRQHIPLDKIKEHADGCRINLDKLQPSLINKLHYIIKSRLDIENKE
jgi:hypothetical protein